MLPNFYKNATIYYDFTTTTAVTNAFLKKNRNKKNHLCTTFAKLLQSFSEFTTCYKTLQL